MYFKEYLLCKQSIQDLETTEVKEKNSLKIKLLAALVAHPSPLANFFISNFSFLTLPNIISNNTPIPFL